MFSFLTDIDECVDGGVNDCGPNTNCVNTRGTYRCDCVDGYSGNGKVCKGWSRKKAKFACDPLLVAAWIVKKERTET